MLARLTKTIDRLGGALKRSWTSGPYSIADREIWGLMNVGAQSDAGVTVSREVALSLSPIWKGVNIIGNGCAKAGLQRFKRTAGRGKIEDRTDPTYYLVRSQPNEYTTAFEFWRTIIVHALLEGNGYAAIERSNGGTALSILLLDPTATYPVRKDGVLWYVTSVDTGEGLKYVRLRPADTLHIHGLGYDGICGYSVIYLCKNVIGEAVATQKYAATFFKNGARLSGILEFPGAKPDDKTQTAIREGWDKMYSGVDNANKVALLFGGAKFNPLAIDSQKAQLIESRTFDIIELANLLLLPPYLLGHTARNSYNSLEMEEKAIAAHAFDPWWTAIESECDAKLLTEKERRNDTHFFRWNRKAALQTDAKAEAEVMKIEVETGLMTPDEARGLLDMPELPHQLGNVIFRPNANQTAIDLNKPPPEADSADAAFLRDYAKILASDNTISDVLFNLTDAKSLLEAVNIPVFNGYDEPWLPVIADNGELVSGETISDSAGNIVGGDTIKAEPEPMEPAAEPANNGERAAFMVKKARNKAKLRIMADRDTLCDALQRKVRTIQDKAKQAISGNFVEFVNGIEKTIGDDFDRATSPALTAIAASGGRVGPVRSKFFGEISEKLLLAAECKRSELAKRVGFVLSVAERSCKKLATMAALSGVKR